MNLKLVTHCNRSFSFSPHAGWPRALPAICWRNELIAGFERSSGIVVDVFETEKAGLIETLKACYPALGLAEFARLSLALKRALPETYIELREGLFREYDLRWCERTEETFQLLTDTPEVFQSWVDEKKVSVRDLSPLLALKNTFVEFQPFLSALVELRLSRTEGVRALELGLELFMMGRPLNDLLPSSNEGLKYLKRLEGWRRPRSFALDASLREEVRLWPWPAQVQGEWHRFGDQAGLEIKIRTTSPDDLHKKLERLRQIGDTWSCRA